MNIVRHAERTFFSMELTETRRARAAALPAAVAKLEIAAIYSPNLSRNIDTANLDGIYPGNGLAGNAHV